MWIVCDRFKLTERLTDMTLLSRSNVCLELATALFHEPIYFMHGKWKGLSEGKNW